MEIEKVMGEDEEEEAEEEEEERVAEEGEGIKDMAGSIR